MSQVLVWKSDADGKLFEDKAKYQKHLRKLAAERRQQRKLEQQAREHDQFLDRMGQVGSIEELNEFIKNNWEQFFLNGLRRNAWRSDRKQEKFHEYVDVKLHGMSFRENIGNTHSCPRGGVENFCQKDDKPKGYPGWRGRITINVRPGMHKYRGKDYMKDGWGSDYFDNTIIHTGSGGGGGGEHCKNYSYEVTLWADDFPVMYENLMKQRMWKHVSGKTVEFV